MKYLTLLLVVFTVSMAKADYRGFKMKPVPESKLESYNLNCLKALDDVEANLERIASLQVRMEANKGFWGSKNLYHQSEVKIREYEDLRKELSYKAKLTCMLFGMAISSVEEEN